MCFPFWMRVLCVVCLLANVFAMPNLTGLDKPLESMYMLATVLAAEFVGRYFETAERQKFIERRRPNSKTSV